MAAAFSLLMFPLNASAEMHEKSSGKVDVITLMQASGCEPTTRNKNMQMIRSAFGNFASLTIEKYGIHPNYQGKN